MRKINTARHARYQCRSQANQIPSLGWQLCARPARQSGERGKESRCLIFIVLALGQSRVDGL